MDSTFAEPLHFISFGRRTLTPRVCIVDAKPHIRKFLAESLEELGFITRECTGLAELGTLPAGPTPDLFVLGPSAGAIEAAAMLQALAARAFNGKVLLLGPPDSVTMTTVVEVGEQIGIAMLPPLATPFDGARLRNSVDVLLPAELPPN
jgi:DNA-binding NtrC family response regulator